MIFRFGACELDTRTCELRRSGHALHLEPQVFDVLCYLLRHRERLVTKEEILDSVWGHRFVTPATLNSRLKTARRAIGDNGRAQQVIRTVRGRGFRFIAPVQVLESPSEEVSALPSPSPDAGSPQLEVSGPPVAHHGDPPGHPTPSDAGLVARSAELARLRALLEKVRSGDPQVVFITGEPGIGKSILAAAFLADAAGEARTTRGQGLEQRGAAEAYLPVLDAMGRLFRRPGGAEAAAHLERLAPTWVAQLPGFFAAERVEAAQRRSYGATSSRMLREMAEALEAISVDAPLLLLLEDLHWSDPSTLDLIAWIAQRAESARLLILCTYRPGDADSHLRGLVAQVRRTPCFAEIPLERLSDSDIEELCRRRYPLPALPRELVHHAYRRSQGNPLFALTLLEDWVESGAVAREGGGWRMTRTAAELAAAIPESLSLLFEQRVERLAADDRRILEAGSLAGPEFEVALLSAALALEEEEVEARLQRITRTGQLVRELGITEWPDGTVTSRFGFSHDLLREAVYSRIPHARRVRLHRAVGERLEAGFRSRASERASELALHFRSGQDHPRAVLYLRLAAERAVMRSAQREAVQHVNDALEILRRHPDLPNHGQTELQFQRILGPALLLTRGWGDPDAERAFVRARELSEQIGDPEQIAGVLHRLAYLHEIRGDFHESEPLLQRCLHLSGCAPGPYTSIESHELLSCSLFHQGRFEEALRSAYLAIDAFEPDDPGDPFAAMLGMNAAVASHFWASLALWCLGRPEGALEPLRAAMRITGDSQLIYMQAATHAMAAELYHFRGDLAPLVEHADAARVISMRQGYPFEHAVALTLRGWANAAEGHAREGVDQIRQGLAMQAAAGADIERPYGLGLLADACLRCGRFQDGLAAVDQALGIIERRSRTYFWQAELHRLRGELLAAQGNDDAGADSLRDALRIAAEQQALSLELRAAMSLLRLESRLRRTGSARERVASIYGRFTEGFDTMDLGTARALMETVD
jgi:DNA-binding winged helix-turn-helix (wHTH) protein/tetratricopeptide (TPR) repeat protein